MKITNSWFDNVIIVKDLAIRFIQARSIAADPDIGVADPSVMYFTTISESVYDCLEESINFHGAVRGNGLNRSEYM